MFRKIINAFSSPVKTQVSASRGLNYTINYSTKPKVEITPPVTIAVKTQVSPANEKPAGISFAGDYGFNEQTAKPVSLFKPQSVELVDVVVEVDVKSTDRKPGM